MAFCKNKFWLENPSDLLCDFAIIPTTKMKLSDQMNSLTRLVILVFFIIISINTKKSFLFLFLSLLFIIILYYIQKRTMENYQIENYEVDFNIQTIETQRQLPFVQYNQPSIVMNLNNKSALENKERVVINPGSDTNYISANGRLSGPANPKTLQHFIVTPPSMAMDYWRANGSVNHSHINTESTFDNYLSGYDVSKKCDKVSETDIIYEKYTMIDDEYDNNIYKKRTNPYSSYNNKITIEEGYNENKVSHSIPSNDYEFPYIKHPIIVKDNEYGWVNTSCGYNQDQLCNYNLPSNLQVGKCEKSVSMKEYNKNLFTQTIQPGIYTRNEIVDPINSNIGISYNQQFRPTTSCVNDNNELTYVEHDPRLFTPYQKEHEIPHGITESDVYDPRFTGYGTSYRSYTEDVTGQTRFYYDDINAVRMPNYISRSNIDFAKYADTYGPLTEMNRNGNVNTDYIREMAQDTFLQASLQQRTELQERLMRKRNSEMWQLRKAPIQTSGQRR
jgi:hypothetical protein